MVVMNPANFEQSSPSNAIQQPGLLHMILVEPLLVVATAVFWLLALPLVAVSLGSVKIWDALVALNSGEIATPNPLILRKGRQPEDTPAFVCPTEIWASSHI